jgi:Fe-S-cluster-containing hydrogenase component 2/CRP-like cAMP-binding protein
MKDLPLTWRQFLQIVVDGIAPTGHGTELAGADGPRITESIDRSTDELRNREAESRRRVADLETQLDHVEKDSSLSTEERQQQKAALEDAIIKAGKEAKNALDAYWNPLLTLVRQVKGFNLGGIRGLRTLIGDETTPDDDLSRQSPEKRLFFLIEYRPGEMITQKGTYSDYAALHEQGVVRVCLEALQGESRTAKSCWKAPRFSASVVPRTWLGRAVNRLFSVGGQEKSLPTAPHEGSTTVIGNGTNLPGLTRSLWSDGEASGRQKRDFADRLMGLTSVVWKQPRTATLIAGDDEQGKSCRMVLIKRILLRECLLFADRDHTQPTHLYLSKMENFLNQSLPALLAQNRLFRPLFYVEEVGNWENLLKGLSRNNDTPVLPAQRRIGDSLPRKVRKWFGDLETSRLDDADQYRVVSELNDLLKRPDLCESKAWPSDKLPPEEQELREKGPKGRTVVETYRLNRLLVEGAFPGVFRSVRDFRPRLDADFEHLVKVVRDHSSVVPTPLRPREGEVIFEDGTAADGLYIILEGRVRLNLKSPGSHIAFNHLVENGFFGESCIDEEHPKYLYQAEALTNCNLLKIERRAILAIAKEFPDFNDMLLWEAARMRRRIEHAILGHRLPPVDLPPPTAAKLMRATNLLVIDMDRCTRCDQCVQACSASHQGHPRFHRANPDLRIGRFEIAGACVHCSDAPCLEDCPVGAIALLENGSVQVLRDRCISCRKCERVCPFGVIEYHPPIDAADGASADKEDYVVSHKCYLCLTPERDPPCVVACPYGAAKRGDPSVFFPGLRSMARFTDPE